MFLQGSIHKAVFGLLLVAFVFSCFFGIIHYGIDSQMSSQTGPCPLMPGVVICKMTPLQHITVAQTMSTALPQLFDFWALVLMLLTSIIAAVVISKAFHAPPHATSSRLISRNKRVPFSPLLEAFSSGIIHSRAF